MLEKEKRKKNYSQQRETKRKSVWAIALGDKKKNNNNHNNNNNIVPSENF